MSHQYCEIEQSGALVDADEVDEGRRPRPPTELWAGMVAEVATMPDVVANLLREHQPDAKGFCTGSGCGSAGRGMPATRWPCSLYALAAEADQRERRGGR